ncbi:hypothetical protein ACF0H5_008516 [Mactra antiquata]
MKAKRKLFSSMMTSTPNKIDTSSESSYMEMKPTKRKSATIAKCDCCKQSGSNAQSSKRKKQAVKDSVPAVADIDICANPQQNETSFEDNPNNLQSPTFIASNIPHSYNLTSPVVNSLNINQTMLDQQQQEDEDSCSVSEQSVSGPLSFDQAVQRHLEEVLPDESLNLKNRIGEQKEKILLIEEMGFKLSEENKSLKDQHNVSTSNVPDVVSSVLKLANIDANKLPSKPTILEMNLQRLCLAQEQLIRRFSTKENTTLLSDQTSKFRTKFMGYEAADAEGNLWVLGIREIETKSANILYLKKFFFTLLRPVPMLKTKYPKILCVISVLQCRIDQQQR